MCDYISFQQWCIGLIWKQNQNQTTMHEIYQIIYPIPEDSNKLWILKKLLGWKLNKSQEENLFSTNLRPRLKVLC